MRELIKELNASEVIIIGRFVRIGFHDGIKSALFKNIRLKETGEMLTDHSWIDIVNKDFEGVMNGYYEIETEANSYIKRGRNRLELDYGFDKVKSIKQISRYNVRFSEEIHEDFAEVLFSNDIEHIYNLSCEKCKYKEGEQDLCLLKGSSLFFDLRESELEIPYWCPYLLELIEREKVGECLSCYFYSFNENKKAFMCRDKENMIARVRNLINHLHDKVKIPRWCERKGGK